MEHSGLQTLLHLPQPSGTQNPYDDTHALHTGSFLAPRERQRKPNSRVRPRARNRSEDPASRHLDSGFQDWQPFNLQTLADHLGRVRSKPLIPRDGRCFAGLPFIHWLFLKQFLLCLRVVETLYMLSIALLSRSCKVCVGPWARKHCRRLPATTWFKLVRSVCWPFISSKALSCPHLAESSCS